MTASLLAQMLVHGAALGAGVAILCLLGLRIRKDKPGSALKSLAAFITVLMLVVVTGIVDALELPWLFGIELVALPFLPVTLWLYVRAVTDGDGRPWRHLVAPSIAVLCLLPLFTLDAGVKQALVAGRVGPSHMIQQILAAVGVLAAWLIWMGLLVGYGFASLRRLRDHDRHLRDRVSNLAGLDLGWLRSLIAIIAIAVGLATLDQLSAVLGFDILPPVAVAVFEAALILMFGVLGLHQQAIPQPMPDTAKSYARSPLTETDCDRILDKLDAAMQAGPLWHDPFLNLDRLAEAAGVKPNAISQALNTRRQRNFFDYVNGWRVDEACRLLRDTDRGVLDISEAVGFNSKSTFNAAFVKHVGETPTQYRRS